MASKDALEAAFARYVGDGTEDALNEAIETGRPLAMWLAKKAWWGMRGSADLDDVKSWALVGLWKAVKTFDPEKNEAAAYVTQKVRWEILDAVRKWAWFGRRNARHDFTIRSIGPGDFLGADEERRFTPNQCFGDDSEDRDVFIEQDYINNALRGAPREYRLIVTLMAILGMSRREAAITAGYTERYVGLILPKIQAMFKMADEREAA